MSSEAVIFGYDGILYQDSIRKKLKEIAELRAKVEAGQEKLRREMAEIMGVIKLLEGVENVQTNRDKEQPSV